MADSVALLVAANLATIGGHVAEMISIFVYPVIGYFWTRRRRRSPSMDFNAEGSTISMAPSEELKPVDMLASCISRLRAILQALESLSSDEAMIKLHRGQARFNQLMQEHYNLQQAASTLMQEMPDMTTASNHIVQQRASQISHGTRLLELKCEMLSVESYQMKIVWNRNGDSVCSMPMKNIDLEEGLHIEPPTPCRVKPTNLQKADEIDELGQGSTVGDVDVLSAHEAPPSKLSVHGVAESDWECDADDDELPLDIKLHVQKQSSSSLGLRVSRTVIM